MPKEGMQMTFGMIFPGQGSQSVGMMSELANQEPDFGLTFDEASDVLGYDLWQVAQEGPDERLNSTDITQPALLTAGVAVYRAWRTRGGIAPAVMAGHSLGEYTALVCAGGLDFREAVQLVQLRGRFMQAAVPAGRGAMAAILGLSDEQVAEACSGVEGDQVVEPVNFNSPGQVVIAGDRDAVEKAILAAKELGARRAVLLPVSVPSHCSLMREAATSLAEQLAQTCVKTPDIPVIHNVDARLHPDPVEIRDSLERQLYQPVRWSDCVIAIREFGASKLVEAGPGRVLTGLTRRIDRSIVSHGIFDVPSLAETLAELE